MMLKGAAFRLLALARLGALPGPCAGSTLTAVPSAGNAILAEQNVDAGKATTITSSVPVSLLRYSDSGKFMIGQQPVPEMKLKVLVTSDCATSETNAIPSFGLSEDGDVTVSIDVPEADAEAMDFLAPSSFSALWSYESFWCREMQNQETVVDASPGLVVDVSQCGSATCDKGEFCRLPTGVCDPAASASKGATCEPTMDMCATVYLPVCGCDGKTYSSECVANAAGVNVASEGECGKVPDAVPISGTGSGAECDAGEGADPAKGCGADEFCQAPSGVCDSSDGTCQAKSQMCFELWEPVCGCDGKTYGNGCKANSAGVNVASKGECGGMGINVVPESLDSASTTDASTPATAEGATTTMATTAASIPGEPVDAGSPTTSPTSKPVAGSEPAASGAFDRPRSFSFYVWTFMMATAILSLVLPNGSSWAFGKFTVAAVTASALISKGSNIRKNNSQGSASSPAQQGRVLETCTFNVEVLYDGCNNALEIVAPSFRVVDVAIQDLATNTPDGDPCTTDYDASLNFPVTNTVSDLTLSTGGSVPKFDEFGSECLKAIEGRPFIDATGGTLQATPWISSSKDEYASSALSWTGDVEAQNTLNTTIQGRLVLGEDWTHRALGEHASVASFSAFSIALMTNQAPSDLVNDALRAGLDEVRHATTSFDIASKLVGKEVGPGPLPESKLEFGHDLKALALAVAREGCVDETLSAFAAAVEADHIADVMIKGAVNSHYHGIDDDLLDFIRKELVTIAMDESNHSALAWRTLNWVCSIDSNVCEAVHKEVFDESSLETRFSRRADASFGEKSFVLQTMRKEWTKIFNAHMHAHTGKGNEPVCKKGGSVEIYDEGHHFAVTEKIVHQISCI